MSAYSITSKTEFNETTIVTIEQAVSRRCWTLVATADGEDVLITPAGKHIDLTFGQEQTGAAADVVAWIMGNV